MKIILSPAKLMNEDPLGFIQNPTQPLLYKKANALQKELKKLSPKDLSQLMNLSDSLAQLNWERNQIWGTKKAVSIPAIEAFNGEVFKGFDIESLSHSSFHYLENNVYILSGLYGILRPQDAIYPYRLEMGTAWAKDAKNLYQYWNNDISDCLKKMSKPNEILLNLASVEYSKVLDKKSLDMNWVDVDFKELREGKLKSIMVFFKQARGKMARFCVDNSVDTLEEVKTFSLDGYQYAEEHSTDHRLTFIR